MKRLQFLVLVNTSYFVACTERNITVLTLLLSSRANVIESRRDFSGCSAIQICIENEWLPGVSIAIAQVERSA